DTHDRRAGPAPRREPRVSNARPFRLERVLDRGRERRAVERDEARAHDHTAACRERERVFLAETARERAGLQPAPAARGLRRDLDRNLLRIAIHSAERHDRAIELDHDLAALRYVRARGRDPSDPERLAGLR